MMKAVAIDDIQSIRVNHQSGYKKILFSGSDCDSPITQIAAGCLPAGEIVEEHEHPSMEEFFFFQSGIGYLTIDGFTHEVSSDIIIRVPVGARHMLVAQTDLRFFYFGIAV
jgi:mannose-6-phosphate isomerase-like protein (cupin superfamily)